MVLEIDGFGMNKCKSILDFCDYGSLVVKKDFKQCVKYMQGRIEDIGKRINNIIQWNFYGIIRRVDRK